MKNDILEYKKYIAKLDFDLEEGIIIGKVINAKDPISFHANTLTDIKQAFKDIILILILKFVKQREFIHLNHILESLI